MFVWNTKWRRDSAPIFHLYIVSVIHMVTVVTRYSMTWAERDYYRSANNDKIRWNGRVRAFIGNWRSFEIIARMEDRLQGETIVIDDNWRLQDAMTPNAVSYIWPITRLSTRSPICRGAEVSKLMSSRQIINLNCKLTLQNRRLSAWLQIELVSGNKTSEAKWRSLGK